MKLFISFLILILPLACSQNKSADYTESPNYDEAYAVEEEIAFKASESSKDEYEIIKNNEASVEQKLIKESFLEFETEDLDKTYSNIARFVKQNNGFIQDDNSNKNYNRISRNLTIRIPTNGFQNVLDSISGSVSFFDTKRVSSKDVTEEFIDLEARLKAKKTLETRYLELLSKAKNVKEILDIERELSNIREEIEAKQGRLKYLNNKVSLSTINIQFYKTTTESKITQSYGSKMWKAIASGFNGLSLFFLGLLHIWPFIILLIIGFFLLKRWINKKNKK